MSWKNQGGGETADLLALLHQVFILQSGVSPVDGTARQNLPTKRRRWYSPSGRSSIQGQLA